MHLPLPVKDVKVEAVVRSTNEEISSVDVKVSS